MKRKSRALEHKAFAFKLDAPPDDQGHFTGYAAVFSTVDKGNDVIEPGATTKTVQENPDVPLFWVHNYTLVPIGIGTMTSNAKGIRIRGQLFLETSELAREVFGAMKAGAVKGLSIGYNTLRRSFKNGVRHLQEITIGEVSLAPFPMNPLAEVDSVKDLGGYEATEGVSCLLTAIGAVSDFLVGEVEEGDADDVSRAQAILVSLGKLLSSELDELASADGDNSDGQSISYEEAMSAGLDGAIKSLQQLQTKRGAETLPELDERYSVDEETALDGLRGLLAELKG